MTNGEVCVQQFDYFGLEVELKRESNNSIAQTFYLDLKDINKYNPNKINSIVNKMSLYNHCKFEWKQGQDCHIVLTMYYQQPKIYLGELMNNDFDSVVVGQDTEGQNVCVDFEKCPHLLIAGTTGSGKSVLMNNLICNIYCYYAQQFKKTGKSFEVVLIDPKGCEFNAYKKCVNTTFIDDTIKAIEDLEFECFNMDYRYKHPNENYRERFIIIDEFADLMLTSKSKVEESVVRLAQKGRACGIHLIIATQRPTVNVISGLIKANITTRFALKTASIRDSINIIDHKGAEVLNGNGDCLVKFPNKIDEVRCQIAYPHQELINKVVETFTPRSRL